MRTMAWGAWGLLLWGVLQLHRLPLSVSHDICGPWGCGPPLPALLACHGAWFVLFAPPVILLSRRLSAVRLRQLGRRLLILAAVGLVVICVYQSLTWLGSAGAWRRAYFPQRCAFVIVTLTDLPLVQLFVAGTVMWSVGYRRFRRAIDTAPSASTELLNSPSASPHASLPQQ